MASKKYIKEKLQILRDMNIELPPKSKIEELYQEKNEIKVDIFFHTLMFREDSK